MGNGPGDIWQYTEIINKYPKLIGGCIWEWADHVVTVDEVQKYGGDFEGELTHDLNFCCDGMVFSDRSFKAGTYEVKAAYQPMATSLNGNILTVTNRFDFTSFEEYNLIVTLEKDGECVYENTYKLNTEPHATSNIEVQLPNLDAKYGVFLNCKLQKGNCEVAHTQHKLDYNKIANPCDLDLPDFEEDKEYIIAKGENFEYKFSKFYGNFTSIKVNGNEQLAERLSLTVWRAPVDNDRSLKAIWGNVNIWQGENLDCLFSKVYDCFIKDGVITVIGSLTGVSRTPLLKYTLTVKISNAGKITYFLDGDIRKTAPYRNGDIWLPRLGFEFAVEGSNREFLYYNNGPFESYCDMCHAGSVGLYYSNAD